MSATKVSIPLDTKGAFILKRLEGNFDGVGSKPVPQSYLYDAFLQNFGEDIMPTLEDAYQRGLIVKPAKSTHSWHITQLGMVALNAFEESSPHAAAVKRPPGRPRKVVDEGSEG